MTYKVEKIETYGQAKVYIDECLSRALKCVFYDSQVIELKRIKKETLEELKEFILDPNQVAIMAICKEYDRQVKGIVRGREIDTDI